jgi:aspartyl-tRNA synthetase
MILCGAKTIRDVIPFPKTQKGSCLLTEAPSFVSAAQIRELGLRQRSKENPGQGQRTDNR